MCHMCKVNKKLFETCIPEYSDVNEELSCPDCNEKGGICVEKKTLKMTTGIVMQSRAFCMKCKGASNPIYIGDGVNPFSMAQTARFN
jgi:hypothetical protein